MGYIIRLTPKGLAPVKVPEFAKLSDQELVPLVGSDSAVWRQAAQREVLARGEKPGTVAALQKIVDTNSNIGARVAALYTLKLMLGGKSTPILVEYTKKEDLREHALRVLADDERIAKEIPAKPFIDALEDKNPKIRLQAVTGLGHLWKAEAAEQILQRTADSDYTVAHIAVRMLMRLKAAEVCLAALDSSDTKVQPGALRVLQSIYEPAVVEGLLQRLSTHDEPLHTGIFKALCRLDTKEATYTEPGQWWGTRPDTSGPIYKPLRWDESDKIETAVKEALTHAKPEQAKELVAFIMRTKVTFPGLTELMLEKSGKDTASRLDVLATLISPKTPTTQDIISVLVATATSPTEQPELRVRALRMLNSISEKNMDAVANAYLPLALVREPQGPLASAWEEFTRDSRLGKHVNEFVKLARDKDEAKRNLGQTVLVNIVTSTVSKDQKAKDAAYKALEEMWKKDDQAASLLGVIGKAHAVQFGDDVRKQLNNKNHVVAEAAEYALTKLGLDKAPNVASKTIGEMKYEDVVKAAIAAKGDPQVGQQLFLRQGCFVCHTLTSKEPPKGPMLGGILTRYTKEEVCESILKPSAKIAQGFESQHFKMKNNTELDGFVVKEGGDSVEVRNILGATTILEKADIVVRQRMEKSIMPEGIVNNITPDDLASLLAFLQTTSAK